MEGRLIEYVDHLHEHFVEPVVIAGGRYQVPTAAGYSIQMLENSVAMFQFPEGAAWRERARLTASNSTRNS